jgi:hypothetical protein
MNRVSRISTRALRACAAVAVAALFSLGAPTPARAQLDPGQRYHSSPVGVADGQYARLHAYFVTGHSELPPGPCRLTLRFIDHTGAALVESVVTLVPNRDTMLDYQPQGLRPGERATVRALVLAEPDERGVAPRIIPSLEVVDAPSGRTTIADPGAVRALDPGGFGPRQFSTFGMASEQVARVTASYVGLPSDSGLPPGPCNVLLTIHSGNGSVLVTREVTVSPGQTVSLDFPAGTMVPGIRRRMWATQSTDGREQGFVTSSVEIFDAPNGKSTVLHPSSFVQSWGWE